MFSVKINGLDDIANALAQYADLVSAGAKDAIAKSANEIADTAKSNTSGAIADTITANVADDGLSATVTANSELAAYVEYGLNIPGIKAKTKAEPRPFLNPAFEEKVPDLIDNLTQIVQG